MLAAILYGGIIYAGGIGAVKDFVKDESSGFVICG